MPRLRRYVCPSCEGSFEVLHRTSAEPPPRFCARCGFDTQEAEPLAEPLAMPYFSSARARSVDAHYRSAEEGSEYRATVAREMGLDAEAANQLKLTNQKDGLREGDIAAVPVNNAVTQFMAQAPSGTPVGYVTNGPGYSGAVASGPFPNAGALTQSHIRQQHQRFLAGSGHKGTTSCDAPAIETMNPNYQPRVK